MTVTSSATTPPVPAGAAGPAGLARQIRGPVLLAGDERVAAEVAGFNVATTHRPAVVVGATCAEDVAAAVRLAVARGLPVAVQATGHGAVTPADGAVLVTTARMRGVAVDPVARTARAEAGCRWSDVIAATSPHGLAPLCGSSSSVGVVGYTLGGGVGPLARRYGFAADHVRRLEVVTADGVLRTVDADHEPDLFWALRGGKGSFGVVTAVEFDLVEVATLYGGGLFFPGDRARTVLTAYRAWAATVGEETTSSVAVLSLPPLPELPEPLRGQTVVHVRVAHLGGQEDGERLVAPLRAAAPVLLDHLGVLPFAAVDSVHQDPTSPMPVWERGLLLRDLTPATVDALLAVAGPGSGAPVLGVELRHLGGALARPAAVPNAVAGRGAAFSLLVLGVATPALADVLPRVGDAVAEAVAPWRAEGALVNFLGDATTPEQVRAAWSPEVLARLLEVKRRHDPADVFRFGHAIRHAPAQMSARATAGGRGLPEQGPRGLLRRLLPR